MSLSTEQVWEQFSSRLLAYIRKRLADPDEAEDVLQDVFIKIHTRMHTLTDQDSLPAWIYQITRNAIIDRYRTKKFQAGLDESIPAESAEPSSEEDALARLAGSLGEMIACLPDTYQQALQLGEIEGWKQEQVARQLGLSLSGAKSRLQRGRRLLKQSLLDCCHFELDRRGQVIDYFPRQVCCTQCSDSMSQA